MVKPKQPVFLLCGERSGSNLIRVIMNSHSEFLAPEPLHLMRLMWAELGAYGDLSNNENWNALVRHTSLILRHQVGEIGPRFDEDEIKRNVTRRSFADIFDFIYVTALEAKKKRRLFLKELYVHEYLPLILAHYPDAKFVYQTRDPRDVALSMTRLPFQGGLLWARHVLREEQQSLLNVYHALSPERVFVQRYEDLLRRPREVLVGLCAFLEVEFEEQILEYYKVEENRLSAQKSAAWRNLSRPILEENQQKFRTELSELEIGLIERSAKPYMDALEYEPVGHGLSLWGRLISFFAQFEFTRRKLDGLFMKKRTAWPEEERVQREQFDSILHRIYEERGRLEVRVPRVY